MGAMRAAPLLLLVLLVAGLATWLLWPGRGQAPDDQGPGLETSREEADGEPEEGLAALRGGNRPPRPPRPPGPRYPVIPSSAIPRGALEVVPLGPDGRELPVDQVVVDLQRQGAKLWAPRLPTRDEETGVWRFEDVPWGRVDVHVYGEHVKHTVVAADVPKDEAGRIRVPTASAGAIAFEASLPDGAAPAHVKFRLISPRSKRPVPVHYRSENSTAQTPRMEQGETDAKGLIYAIPAGTYRLEATSAEGARETMVVTVKNGETVEVQIPFSY
jgi:hypothetical protein